MARISMIQKHETVTAQKAFADFLQNCKMKNLAQKTVKNYDATFKKFLDFYRLEDVAFISQEIVNQYVLFLQRQLDNPISVNTYLRNIRAILHYFAEQNYMQLVKIKMLKTEQPLKEPYTDYELQLLLKKPDVKKCSFREFRTWAIINFFIATGARIRSVVNVKIGDMDFENGLVKLAVTKNRKPQVLPLPQSMLQILKEYLRIRLGGSDDYLFSSSTGTKMIESSVGHNVAEYNRARGS
jgi:integrase/recombinase XerD